MSRLARVVILVLYLAVTFVRADYPCVCCYDVDIPVLGQPDPQSQVIDTLYEFDCKPGYGGYNGDSYTAIQIGGKIGYVDIQSNIQQQVCSGEPSLDDVISTTTQASPTTQLTSTPGKATSSSEMPHTVSTTQFATPLATKLPTTSTTVMLTTTVTTGRPTVSSTKRPTTIPSTERSTTTSSTQRPTTNPTTEIRTTAPTTVTTTRGSSMLPYHTSNVTNSVLRFIGIAYNLTNGNPVRGTTTPSMIDPGLLPGNQVFQLNEFPNGTSREVEMTTLSGSCGTQYSLIYNGKSYQDELLSFARPTVDHPQQLLDSAFMFNPEFNKVRSYTENSQSANIYQDVMTVCSQKQLRLKEELADREPFSITRDFAKDACDLPKRFYVNEYVDFLDKWGTSIVVEAVLGTKELKRYPKTEPAVFKEAMQETPSLVQHAGSYKGYASSLTFSRQDYAAKVNRTSNLDSGLFLYRSTGMVPVGLKLRPITFALKWIFWKGVISNFISMGVCPEGFTTASIQNIAGNINKTLPQYFAAKNQIAGLNLAPLTDGDLQIPVTWPKGTYGLMKPKTGCPTGHVTWHEGWRVQGSADLTTHNHFSSDIRNTLSGTFDDLVQTQFCMKTDPTTSPYEMDWPKGSYCILKKGNCPAGFEVGNEFWDDGDFFNKNKHGGTLPDGDYGQNTRIYYCCRADGSTSNPITLPQDRSFVLIRYKGACQHVYGMGMREVYIEWDTADLFNKDDESGAHPFDDGGDQHRLHFCFYYFNIGG